MGVKNALLRSVSLLLLVCMLAVFGCTPSTEKGVSSSTEGEASSNASFSGVSSSDDESEGVSEVSSEEGVSSQVSSVVSSVSSVQSSSSQSSSSQPVVFYPDSKPVKGIIRDKYYTLTNKASGKALESGFVQNMAPHSTTTTLSEADSKDTDLQRFQLYEAAEGVL